MKSLEELREDWETTLFDAREKFGWSTGFVCRMIEDMTIEGPDDWRERCPKWQSGESYSAHRKKYIRYILSVAKEYTINDLVIELSETYYVSSQLGPAFIKTLKRAGLTRVECAVIPRNPDMIERLKLYSSDEILEHSAHAWPYITNETCQWYHDGGRIRDLFSRKTSATSSSLGLARNATLALELGFTSENCVYIREFESKKVNILKSLRRQRSDLLAIMRKIE